MQEKQEQIILAGEHALISLADEVIWENVNRPMLIVSPFGIVEIPKDVIVCDACNEAVERERDWALVFVDRIDCKTFVEEVVCEECRKRYFDNLPTLSSVDALYE